MNWKQGSTWTQSTSDWDGDTSEKFPTQRQYRWTVIENRKKMVFFNSHWYLSNSVAHERWECAAAIRFRNLTHQTNQILCQKKKWRRKMENMRKQLRKRWLPGVFCKSVWGRNEVPLSSLNIRQIVLQCYESLWLVLWQSESEQKVTASTANVFWIDLMMPQS